MRRRGISAKAVRGVETVIGRPRLARYARFLTNEVRRDVPNEIADNGETEVQRAALGLEDAPVVFDVGAHYGEWSTALLDQAAAEPALYAFEPSRHCHDELTARLTIPSARIERLALSDTAGEVTLHVPHRGAASNSVVPFHDRGHATEAETVETSTLDDYCEAAGISRITLLKSDAEGHDLAVLEGGRRLFERGAIALVQFEYNARWIDARHFLADAFDLLGGWGYDLGKVTPDGVEFYDSWDVELESFREANYLACLPSVRDHFSEVRWWNA
jgi:FkbM family methyltransferase